MNSFSYYDTVILSQGALFLGIIMLIKGGSWAVEASIFVANRYSVPPMVVGFTIVAFGTSLPELVVSLFANLQGSPGIALGNVLGSNIANILLVLGFTALILTLKTALSRTLIRDLSFMMFATLMLTGLLYYGEIPRLAGFLMVAILAIYVIMQYFVTKAEAVEEELKVVVFRNDFVAYGTLFLGLICIAVGAEFLVKGAKVSAELIGVPESVIALSLIAFGTSLPELTTSIIAARKGQADMVIGNIIGSNVFNILMIVGIVTMVKPIEQGSFEPQVASFDIWVTLGVGFIFTLILLLFGRINRVIGALFFVSYIFYNMYIYMAYMGA